MSEPTPEPRALEAVAEAPPAKRTLSERYKELMAEFGAIAFATYLTIFVVVLVTFATLIKLGFDVEGADEQAGTWFSAWLATKVTQPVRILATIALTPMVAAVWHKVRPPKPPEGEPAADG